MLLHPVLATSFTSHEQTAVGLFCTVCKSSCERLQLKSLGQQHASLQLPVSGRGYVFVTSSLLTIQELDIQPRACKLVHKWCHRQRSSACEYNAMMVCSSPGIGLQGALGLSGGTWSGNWQITKSTKCVHLLRRLMDIGAAPDCPSPQVH